jgi:hypothetical protein
MTSDDLTAEQASKLYEALFPHVNYLLRLKKRWEDLRFPEDDPLREYYPGRFRWLLQRRYGRRDDDCGLMATGVKVNLRNSTGPWSP